jgi:hypothetical protein
VNGDDPSLNDVIDVLRPLAEHRGMADPARPLVFHSDDDWGHCCIWRSLNRRPPPEPLNAIGDARIDCFEHF